MYVMKGATAEVLADIYIRCEVKEESERDIK